MSMPRKTKRIMANASPNEISVRGRRSRLSENPCVCSPALVASISEGVLSTGSGYEAFVKVLLGGILYDYILHRSGGWFISHHVLGNNHEGPDRTELDPHIEHIQIIEHIMARDREHNTTATKGDGLPERAPAHPSQSKCFPGDDDEQHKVESQPGRTAFGQDMQVVIMGMTLRDRPPADVEVRIGGIEVSRTDAKDRIGQPHAPGSLPVSHALDH